MEDIEKEMKKDQLTEFIVNKYYNEACVYANKKADEFFYPTSKFKIFFILLFTNKWSRKYREFKSEFLEEKTSCLTRKN